MKAWPVSCVGAIDRRRRAAFQLVHAITIPPCPGPPCLSPCPPLPNPAFVPWRERAIQSMTAAWDPKLCKSLVPIFNTILKERPYLRQASYILSSIGSMPRATGTWAPIITSISSIFLPLSIPESWKVRASEKFSLSGRRGASVRCSFPFIRARPVIRSQGTSRHWHLPPWNEL